MVRKVDSFPVRYENSLMEATFSLPDDLMREIQVFSEHKGQRVDEVVTNLLRKALLADGERGNAEADLSTTIESRRTIAEKFISGEWGVELEGYEASRDANREQARLHAERWSQ